MITHNLHVGISGCDLQLIQNSVVRKISPSEEYNDRLENQMKKQLLFNMPVDNIIVPRVLGQGNLNGLFYFDMEYINGSLFNETFQRISKSELEYHLQTLMSYLSRPNYLFYTRNEMKDIVVTKLVNLRKKSQYKKLIDWMVDGIAWDNIKDIIPKGYCHGDLTFSNILFVDDNLCFLDFLDSYIESPIMDVIKLKQDLYYGWYLNFLPVDFIYVTRMKQVFRHLWSQIEQEYSKMIHTELFDVFDIINYLRIEPYITTDLQLEVLQKTIKDTVIYEKFNCSDGGEFN